MLFIKSRLGSFLGRICYESVALVYAGRGRFGVL